MPGRKKIIFIGGWTRDKRSYHKLFAQTPPGCSISFISCHDLIANKNGIDSRDFSAIDQCYSTEKVILVAHSLGGIPATEYAFLHPGRIARLVLIDSAGVSGEISMASILWSSFRSQFQHMHKKVKQNLLTTKNALKQPRKSLSTMLMAYRYNISMLLPDVIVNTLVLWGEADHVYNVEQARIFKEKIKNSKLSILPNMDHDWIIHNPELFWEQVNSYSD